MTSETTSSFGKDRLLALDLLRGIAAAIVAFGHAGVFSRALGGFMTIDYTLCVAFFFILSGYVLSHAYGDEIASGRMTMRDFVVARLARLYPLHAATAVAVAVMCIAAFIWRGHMPDFLTRVGVIETATLTQSIFSGGWSLDTPSWSIGAEFWCGLILVPLCLGSRRGRWIAIAVAALAFVFTDIRGGFIESSRLRYATALGCFVIGWGAYHIRRKDLHGWDGRSQR